MPTLPLGSANSVILIDVFVGDGPALLRGIRLRVLDLSRDGGGFRVLGRLSRVDCGNHLSAPLVVFVSFVVLTPRSFWRFTNA